MKILLTILYSIVGMFSYAQEFQFAQDGKMENGYAHLDTIMRLDQKANANKAFVFKKIDQGQNFIIINTDTIFFNMNLNSQDSFERFCLINTGDAAIRIRKQDWSLISIKEAQTYAGKWKPIEFWNYSWCGNSYYDYSIMSGQVLLLRTYKQFGETATRLRLRLRTESNGVVVSDWYDGFFDENCFLISGQLKRFKYKMKGNHYILAIAAQRLTVAYQNNG